MCVDDESGSGGESIGIGRGLVSILVLPLGEREGRDLCLSLSSGM